MAQEAPVDEYEERYVAFVDLLGFKQQVEMAENAPAERAKLLEILNVVKDTLGENPYLGFRRNYFSDCIVYSAKRTHYGLSEMFHATTLLTLNLLQYDVMVRGGLTAGGAHHSRDFLYGTAVSRAVLLESGRPGQKEEPRPPMTVISDEVAEDVKNIAPELANWVATDPSGKKFVHFLVQYQIYREKPLYQGMQFLDRPGGRMIDFVCQRLNRDTGGALEKAKWFQAYWNQTVAVHGVFKTIEAGVTERFDSGGPVVGVRRMYVPSPADKMQPLT